jgi:hypothetical protein
MRDPIYASTCEVTHIDAHMLLDIRNTQTRVYSLHVRIPAPRNRAYSAHTRTTTHSCKHATHWSAWSVELWASAAAMCCPPSRIEVQFVRALPPTLALYNAVGWRETREAVEASSALGANCAQSCH